MYVPRWWCAWTLTGVSLGEGLRPPPRAWALWLSGYDLPSVAKTSASTAFTCGSLLSNPPAAGANHDPERPRKLLVHRRELERLMGKTRERGLTLVPTRMYFSGPNAKVEIALARGKDVHDKRETIRRREQQREVERALRDAQR